MRAHGLPIDVLEKAKEKNLHVIDATCPMVTKIHVQAEKLKAEGYKIVVVGDPHHPEVKGTLSHVPGAWCIETVEEVDTLPRASRVGVVVQSTYSKARFLDIVKALDGEVLRSARRQHDLHGYQQPPIRGRHAFKRSRKSWSSSAARRRQTPSIWRNSPR